MFSVFVNGNCIALFKMYKSARKRFDKVCKECDIEKDCVELYRHDYPYLVDYA